MIYALLALALHAHFTLFCLNFGIFAIYMFFFINLLLVKPWKCKKKSEKINVFLPALVGGTQQATNYCLASNPRTQLSALHGLHCHSLNCTALHCTALH